MNQIKLRFNAGVEYNGKIYASAIYINGLFSLDIATHRITYLKSFSREKPCYAIHRTAFLYKNEAWFIPQHGSYIAIVDLETLDIQYLKPPFQKINQKAISRINAVYYSGGMINNRYLYLIPTNIDTLLLIDLENKTLYPYYDVSTEDNYYLYGTYAEGCIYLVPYVGKSFMQIELITDNRTCYPWKYPYEAVGDILCYERQLWFCPGRSDFILKMDLDTKKMQEIPLKEAHHTACLYEQIQRYENRLFFIPFHANRILEYFMNDEKISQIYLEEDLLKEGWNGFTKIFSEKNIILASYEKSFVLIYEKREDIFLKLSLEIDRDILLCEIEHGEESLPFKIENYIHKDMYAGNEDYRENFWGLKKYMELIPDVVFSEKGPQKNLGRFIWEKVKQ